MQQGIARVSARAADSVGSHRLLMEERQESVPVTLVKWQNTFEKIGLLTHKAFSNVTPSLILFILCWCKFFTFKMETIDLNLKKRKNL